MNDIIVTNKKIDVFIFQIPNLEYSKIWTLLTEKIEQAPPNFFNTQAVTADLNARPKPSREELIELVKIFAENDLHLLGIAHNELSSNDLSNLDLALITNSNGNNVNNLPNNKLELASEKTKIIRQHVRSGQRIYSESDLVIIGSVNSGAEIISEGNISIFGTLRGRAYAGHKGNNQSFIYCQELDSDLVSIAGIYQNREQIDVYGKNLKDCLIQLDSVNNLQFAGKR